MIQQRADSVVSNYCRYMAICDFLLAYIHVRFGLLHNMSRYAIAKSAIGPAPQAVTKNSELEQKTVVFGMYDDIWLDMRSSS